jgi:hypothetical protein
MGISSPLYQLVLGLIVLGLLVTNSALNLITHPNRVRALALNLGLGAFVYLNWKHGFIRADGHQIGFHFAALTVAVASSVLLEDSAALRRWKLTVLICIGIVSTTTVNFILPGLTTGALGNVQHRVNTNILHLFNLESSRAVYDSRLEGEKAFGDLQRTRTLIGSDTVDVLGFEQSIAILNDFNYQPRPIFQGYSAYTPYLSLANYDYFASEQAPEYALFKLQSVDNRLPTMDDPHVLRLLIQRYKYLYTELGYTVWKKNSGTFDEKENMPEFVRSVDGMVGKPIDLSDLSQKKVWVEIEYHHNLLGKLRSFFFKPVFVQLRITDVDGVESVHRLPQLVGRTGFMLNPVINDMLDYMRAAGGTPKRRVKSIKIETTPQNLDFLKDKVEVKFSLIPESNAGEEYFKSADQALFNMFIDTPSYYSAFIPPHENIIERRRIMVMHAPSEMVFDVPSGAGELNGYFGFVSGAYSESGKTNGAQFTIVWSDGASDPVILLERFLDPVKKLTDRGIQKFHVKLPSSRGQVTLTIGPGPFNEFAFDWTGWSGIEFK